MESWDSGWHLECTLHVYRAGWVIGGRRIFPCTPQSEITFKTRINQKCSRFELAIPDPAVGQPRQDTMHTLQKRFPIMLGEETHRPAQGDSISEPGIHIQVPQVIKDRKTRVIQCIVCNADMMQIVIQAVSIQ